MTQTTGTLSGGAAGLRQVARISVLAAGASWAAAAFAGAYLYQEQGLVPSIIAALYPVMTAVLVLLFAALYERVVSAALAAACIFLIVWGVVAGWGPAVWLSMSVLLVVPTAAASFLFARAARVARCGADSGSRRSMLPSEDAAQTLASACALPAIVLDRSRHGIGDRGLPAV